ncbi:thioredoxin family protein [Virgibacillus sp. W0430]|uniref:thioredoxin family protein n=1 Tax=Virgibacillus sp. W0430 TaxID=3391580 RepID=UPI003F456819
MKKKMLGLLAVLIVLFIALFFVNDYKNKQALQGNDNPYGKDNLRQETIDQLDDPLYKNQIIPEELDKSLANGDDVTVYFYSPTCVYCQRTTPVVVPLTEELGVDMKKMNLLEFDKMEEYEIEGTPTIVHYEDGKEVGRISGERPEADFQQFFEEYVLD